MTGIDSILVYKDKTTSILEWECQKSSVSTRFPCSIQGPKYSSHGCYNRRSTCSELAYTSATPLRSLTTVQYLCVLVGTTNHTYLHIYFVFYYSIMTHIYRLSIFSTNTLVSSNISTLQLLRSLCSLSRSTIAVLHSLCAAYDEQSAVYMIISLMYKYMFQTV